jgi:hypothetical protein
LTGYNDIYRSVRPGEGSDNDDSIPVAKAIPVNVPPPAAEAVDGSQPFPTEVEVRRAEPVDPSPAPFEAPALEAVPPDPIQFFN